MNKFNKLKLKRIITNNHSFFSSFQKVKRIISIILDIKKYTSDSDVNFAIGLLLEN